MRTLTTLELNQTNGGFVIDQGYIKETIIKPLMAGAITGAVIGYMFGQTNLGKYAIAYSLGTAASSVGLSLINQVI